MMKSKTNEAAAAFNVTDRYTVNRTVQADRDPFKRMTPEARAAIVAAVDHVFEHAKATFVAWINQPDDEEHGPVIYEADRDFRDCYGYPAAWDNEAPQPRKRLDPAGMIEAMLRDTACSSDEGLFETIDHD